MKRKIIKIDEDTCNGCGQCANGCPEGAIQMVNHKAHLVGELLCDGLGACIGTCPVGAITIEEREAEPYDEKKVMENILAKGPDVLAAHINHLSSHGQTEYLKTAEEVLKEKGIPMPKLGGSEGHVHGHGGSCPGSMMKDIRKTVSADDGGDRHACPLRSELGQWPIQLKLLNPRAPYLDHADLVISADCVAFAYADFHRRFLKGKILVIFCPKLDNAREEYIEKLAEIFTHNDIKSVSVVRMEVPCCGATTAIVEEAIEKSGKRLVIKEYTVSIEGEMV
jgi:ferredoxin